MMKILAFCLSYIAVWVRVLSPGGARAVAAENITLRKQLISLSRHVNRSPKLTVADRIIFGFLGGLISARRLLRIAVILKPATILKYHRALVNRKYRLLFSNKVLRKPGPKGPSQEVINAIIEMKKRNPRYGYRRIAMQISIAFGVDIDKDVVRRVLKKQVRVVMWLFHSIIIGGKSIAVDYFSCLLLHRLEFATDRQLSLPISIIKSIS